MIQTAARWIQQAFHAARTYAQRELAFELPHRWSEHVRRSTLERLGHVTRGMRNKNFLFGFEKGLNAFPSVCYQTSGSAGCFEHASGRREAVASHAIAADIQNHSSGAIESVVFRRVDVTQVRHIGRKRLVRPSCAAKKETLSRSELSGR